MREALQHDDLVHRRRWTTLLVLCVSLVVIVLDNTILNVALPRLARPAAEGGLGATQSQLQWIVDSYTIIFAGLLLSAGSIGDRFGRYRFLALGLSIFGLGSLLSALATSANMLIATRALMGVGGAFVMPSTLSILTNVFTDPKERAKAIGIWAGVSALGLGVGPISGGFLLTHFWWGSIFLVNLPVVIAGLLLGFLFIPESKDPSPSRLDPLGAFLSITGLVVLLAAVIEAPGRGWTSPEILGGMVGGLVILGAFMAWELRSSHPMLNLDFFRNPRFSAASGAITLTFLGLFGMIFLLTQYLQSVLGYSTIKAGAVLLPQALAIMVAAPLSSVWVERFGNKRVVAGGMGLCALAFATFAFVTVDTSVVAIIGLTVLLGLGMGNVMAPATDSIMGSLPRAKAGVGSAVNDTTRQTGGAIGVAVLGSLLSSRYGPEMTSRLSGTVPPQAIEPLRDSIGKSLGIAEQAPPAVRPVIEAAARESFVSGMHLAALVAATILLLATVAVLIWLPAWAADDVRAAGNGAGPGEPGRLPEDRGPVATPADAPVGAATGGQQIPTGAGAQPGDGAQPGGGALEPIPAVAPPAGADPEPVLDASAPTPRSAVDPLSGS